jgi:hypothetical protein
MPEVTELPQKQKAPETVIPFGKTSPRHPSTTIRETAESQWREPQIHLLYRVLGESVVDIFPEVFVKSVEAGYLFWVNNPSSYLETLFEDELERDDTLAIMRAYAEIAGEDHEGYTIATRSHEDPAMLVWRAQTRRKHNKSE